MRLLAEEKWKKHKNEIKEEIEQQIKILQNTLREFNEFNPENCVPFVVLLYQKYHNKDSCRGCYYAEDDYDIVGEFPMSNEEFIDFYIVFTMQNIENDLRETKLIYQSGQYRKEIEICDATARKIWERIRESKRAEELSDLYTLYRDKCNKTSTLEHTIEYLKKKLSHTEKYTKEYLKHYQEKLDNATSELEALQDPKLDDFYDLLVRTNRFVDEIY